MFTSKHFIQITKPAEIISLLIKREFKHIILKLMQLISIHLVYTYYTYYFTRFHSSQFLSLEKTVISTF